MSAERILLVYTSGHAFSIEKALKKRGLSCRLTPIPRGISSDCGVCVCFDASILPQVEKLISTLPFEVLGIVPAPEQVQP